MTAVQKARLQGFNASLKQRGVLLSLEGSQLTFDALVERVTPDAGQFSLSNQTRNASKIHILRDAPDIEQIIVGGVFMDGSTTHRVTEIEDHPTNITLVFHCETAAA